MASAAEEPRAPSPGLGNETSSVIDPNLPSASLGSTEEVGLPQPRPSSQSSTLGGGSLRPMPPAGPIEELTPELIKRYTDTFKLYEQKKTIKPGKGTPPGSAETKDPPKKDAKEPPKKGGKDAKKGGKDAPPEPQVPALPPWPQFLIMKGHVLLTDLMTLIRVLLKNPKEKDFGLYLSVLPNAEEIQTRQQISLDEFLKLMQLAPIPNQDDHFKILDAFEVFDHTFDGTVEPEELKNILISMGDPDLLTLEEVNEILTMFINPTTNKISYDEFLKTCLSNTNIHDPPPPKPTKKPAK